MDFTIERKERLSTIRLSYMELLLVQAIKVCNTAQSIRQGAIKNVVLNFRNVQKIDEQAARAIASLQEEFINENVSLVICELQPAIKSIFQTTNLLHSLNYAPSEQEAWDIVQMEELEREMESEE